MRRFHLIFFALALAACVSTVDVETDTTQRPAPRERADAGADDADAAELEPDAGPADAGPFAHIWCCPPVSPPVLGCSAPVTCPAALGQPYCHEAPDGGPLEGPAPGDDCAPGP